MSVCETIITNREQRCVQSQCMCTTRSSEFRVFVCDAVVDLTLRSHSCNTVVIVSCRISVAIFLYLEEKCLQKILVQ